MRRARPLAALALVLATGLSTLTGVTTATAEAPDGRPDAERAGAQDSSALLAPGTVTAARSLAAARSALAGDGRDATEALRQLRMARPALAPADRAAAGRLLARPAQDRKKCTVVCVHWRTSGRHRASASWARKVLATASSVHRTFVGAGYRAPKRDGRAGGNAKTDIYVQDLAGGLYGYCTSDQRTRAEDVWAFCVVDNDYRGFPTGTPLQNLQVTVGHEYFHAVQFGYDSYEDQWLLEGTAAWVEDELFDDVDDNRQYLAASPLSDPARPMDRGGDDGFHYGTWLFFRHLSERLDQRAGTLPTVVRDIWRQADARAGAPDLSSVDAVAAVLEDRGTRFPVAFAQFATGNRRPAQAYDEGSAAEYRPAPLARSATAATGGAAVSWRTELAHLSSATLEVRTQPSATGVRVEVDLPAGGATRAVATLVGTDGAAESRLVELGASGNGAVTASFRAGTVASVEVTVANADIRYECWKRTDYACQGTPLGDGQATAVRVSAS
ncbi:MXAN_6640 family putative metalloprotease [Nocardioides sp. NPDC092400]|uniref:MXAN_6640 family putative metalloprotease n=1 Tax=Nocardioides sp. NPDC092400 TaxID=3155196 RepID=UPI00341DDB8B